MKKKTKCDICGGEVKDKKEIKKTKHKLCNVCKKNFLKHFPMLK